MYCVTINFLSALSFSWTISMLFAGLSCAALSGAKPNSIAATKPAAVLFNTCICMVSSPCDCVSNNRNLLFNAIEAIAEDVEGDRTITVRVRNTRIRTVHVVGQGSGPGFRDDTQELLFEPFYTTKPTGMGMEVSIVRSIIETHAWSSRSRRRTSSWSAGISTVQAAL